MFSILIPTVDNLPYLKLCLSCIEKYSSVDYEILIFNNGGNPETTSFIEGLPHRSLHSRFNRGVSHAYNALAREAAGDYLLLWDDDKMALPGWDLEVYPMLKADGRYSWKSLVEIWPHRTNPCSIYGDYGKGPLDFDEERLLLDVSELTFPRKVSLSVSQVMSKELFFAIGGYDEKFYPGFGSDPDIMWRAFCFLGKDEDRFLNANKSFYYHFTSATTNRIFRYRWMTYGLRGWGRALFALKHGFPTGRLREKTGHGRLVP